MTSHEVHYREVITREPPWWIVTLYGRHLPEEGVSARRRSYADIDIAALLLQPSYLEFPELRDATWKVERDHGPEINSELERFRQAKVALWDAQEAYHNLGHQLTAALAEVQNRVHVLTGIGRMTIDRILSDGPETARPEVSEP